MKGCGKILIMIGFLTSMLLCYVHLQINSVLVSFDIHKSSKIFAEKQELLRRVQFKVDQLRAPRLLEAKMKKNELGLGLPNKIQVVEVPPAAEIKMPVPQEQETTHSISTTISNFLGRCIQTAQAKTDFAS